MCIIIIIIIVYSLHKDPGGRMRYEQLQETAFFKKYDTASGIDVKGWYHTVKKAFPWEGVIAMTTVAKATVRIFALKILLYNFSILISAVQLFNN